MRKEATHGSRQGTSKHLHVDSSVCSLGYLGNKPCKGSREEPKAAGRNEGQEVGSIGRRGRRWAEDWLSLR